jgi:DNA repair protein SbcD/Mre11
MAYTIGFAADTHLGYSARCRSHSSGLNMRVRDGYLGWRETVDQMLAANVDLVLHGGDLFHRSHPGISDIAFARRQIERLADAGIPFIGVTGNHDFANDRGKSPATAAVHDPARNIHEVTDPYQTFTPAPGLNIHAISHIGLAAAERAMPTLIDNEVNILISHGAAQVPGHEIFATVDSPGEAVIGFDVLSMPWTTVLLGHYHGMGALPGFNSGATGQAWYSGSLLRRGFSDPEGGRGWLKVTIHDDGTVSIEPQFINQRRQYDLPVIDAADLTGSEVQELIERNLTTVDLTDAIVRQRVINCPLPVRRGVDTKALADLAAPALVWQPEFMRPAERGLADSTDADAAATSLTTAGSSDLPGMFTGWFAQYAQDTKLAADLRPVVAANGIRLLRDASGDPEITHTPATKEPAE